MKNIRNCIAACLLCAALLISGGCGKKGPPFLAGQELIVKVTQLQAKQEGEAVILEGRALIPEGAGSGHSDVTGCLVYHIWYAPGNEPCKDCPVDFKIFRKIEGEVLSGDTFKGQVRGVGKKGTHYFMVRLVGKKGSEGPPSNKAILVLE